MNHPDRIVSLNVTLVTLFCAASLWVFVRLLTIGAVYDTPSLGFNEARWMAVRWSTSAVTRASAMTNDEFAVFGISTK